MTKIKICGLFRPCDIEYVNAVRPDWCGFIVNFPKSHRNRTPDQVRALRRGLAEGVVPVGVFVDQPVEDVAALLNDGTISVAQLHGHEDAAYIAALRAAAPGHPVWRAFKVRGPEDLEAAGASPADLVILDNGYGTGETFDWSMAGGVARPFLLAGGLTPENIPDAIRLLHPYGLDISSGVETDKQKDPEKIRAAVAAARKA
ncbi:phosphoribosylanthranilate isomerase [uncultured Oscillibacter sp.]|jgi:phosphoribosylanthranilate isomerase|uniref:phosphoribosylanthranilate isomerase n=1 Tax=uncultured Oscillibacter sp. TaxID=876091 RepID=UPI002602897D|nr:phosphoribosylanthranilate isomerase [uncultured Oscillibacter sp.]